jgi:hypothetical protein
MLHRVALIRTDSISTHRAWLVPTANVVPSSPIPVTMMMEAKRSSETSILTRATRRNVQEDGILQVATLEKWHTEQGYP